MPDNIPTPPEGTEVVDPVIPEVDQPADPTPASPEPEIDPVQVDEPIPATDPVDPEPAPAPPAPQPPTVEERYRQSSSEAIILNSKNKNLESTLNKLISEDTPTEAELLAEYPDLKSYNAVTQKLMRDTLGNKKRQMRISLQFIEQDAERKWQADLRQIVRKPEYASLRGDEKFEEFVFQPKHQGVDIQTLADAYLVRTGRAAPAAPAIPPKPASPGLPRGSGGSRTPARPAKISLEQAAILRVNNYKEYLAQVKAGNIEDIP